MGVIFQNSNRYNGLIQYYTKQKNDFLYFVKKSLGEENTQSLQEIQNKFIEGVSTAYTSSLQGQNDISELPSKIIKNILKTSVMGTQNRLNLKQARQEANAARQEYEKLIKQINQSNDEELKKELKLLIATNFDNFLTTAYGQTWLDALQRSLSNAQIGNYQLIRANLLSYLKKVYVSRILQQTTYNPRRQQIINQLAGYYRENLIAQACTDYLSKISDNISITAQGSKNLIEDILIKYDQLNGEGKASIGLQSKSWILPQLDTHFEYKQKSIKAQYFYSISSNAALMQDFLTNSWSSGHSWRENIEFLGETENAKKALGANNILYLVHNSLIFTSDLIKSMRKSDFYISFVFDLSDYIATQKITWQQHRMILNYLYS